MATQATIAHRTTGFGPCFVHFSAVNRNSAVRASSNITGVTFGDARNLTIAGTGVVAYTASGQTIRYTAPGDTAGTPLALTANLQSVKLYSGNGVDWIYIDVTFASLPVGDQSDNITITTVRSTGIQQPTAVLDPGDPDYASLTYYWDFDDPYAINYTLTNNRNSNTCWGAPQSAHLYTQPGIYNPRLYVWDINGNITIYTQTITITRQEDTATIYYVDATSGNNGNAGTNPALPLQTFAAALAKVTSDNIIIKFKRGETFTVSSGITINQNNITLTSYYNVDGSDDITINKPVFNVSITSGTWIQAGSGITDLKICHLSSTGPGSGSTIAIGPGGTNPTQNVTIYDCYITAFHSGIIIGGTHANWGSAIYLSIVACDLYDLGFGAGSVGIYVDMHSAAILGTKILDVTGGEHCARIWGFNNSIIADSLFSRPATIRAALTIRGIVYGTVNATTTLRFTSNCYMAVLRSEFYVDLSGTVCLSANPQNNTSDERIEHIIFDSNKSTTPNNIGSSYQSLGRDFCYRSCISNSVAAGWTFTSAGARAAPRMEWMRVFNCTTISYASGSSTDMISIVGVTGSTTGDTINTIIKNNIWVKAGSTTQTRLWGDSFCDLNTFSTDYNLLEIGGAAQIIGAYTLDTGSTVTRTLAQAQASLSKELNSIHGLASFTNSGAGDYTLQSSSSGIGLGDDSLLPWVRFDASGALRTSNLDAGAFQKNASVWTPPPSLSRLPALGMNVAGYSYYDVEHPFVDVATQDYWRPTSGVAIGIGSITLDSSGQVSALSPGITARKLVFTHNGLIYPTGQYRLEWQGSGSVRLTDNGVATEKTVINSGSNFKVYDVSVGHPHANGLNLEIQTINTGNPIRGVKLLAPFSGYVSGDVFTRPLLNVMTGYGVIRFMTWEQVNIKPQMHWSDRSTLNHSSWGSDSNGVPIERQIDLANTLNADPWICVPHLATDDYVTQLATLVSGRLNSNLRCWVEYSNEVWNWQFPQATYALTGLMPLYGMNNWCQAYGRRNGEVINIFKNICGTGGRIIGVVGGQAATPSVLQNALQGAVISGKQTADVGTIAPYFYIDLSTLYSNYIGGMSNANLLSGAFIELASGATYSAGLCTANKAITDSYGIELTSYEGGQHITAAGNSDWYNNTGFMGLITDIQRDARMGQAYSSYLSQVHASGNKTFVHFVDIGPIGRYGAWGLTENYLDYTAPKYVAYRTYYSGLRSSGNFNLSLTTPPTINNISNASIVENNTNVLTVSSYGLEPITLSIVSGNDQNKFTLNNTTRLLSFTGAPDYENPLDSNLDNTYNLTVKATNINGISTNKNFNITVYNSLSEPGSVLLTSGLNKRWGMQDNASSTTIIESVSGMHGLLTGGHTTSNMSVTGPNIANPRGLNFDGISDAIVISGINTPSGIPFSLSFWMQSDVFDGANGDYIFSATSFGNSVLLNNTTQISVSLFNSATVTRFTVPDLASSWVHVVILKDSGQNTSIYGNGIIASPTTLLSTGNGVFSPTRIGMGGINVYSDFRISDVNFWHNRLLTPGDITSLYNSGSGFTYPWTPCFITSNSGFSITENNTTIGTVTTSGVTPVFSIQGGNDASKVTITTGGILSFITPPDYEAPTDFNLDNIYDFTVQVSNAAGPVLQDVRVTILNDPSDDPIPPTIINGNDVDITENTLLVVDLDANGDTPLTFNIIGGADQALFDIDNSTGILSFLVAPDYDIPLDFDHNNVYEVQIQVSNANGSDNVLLHITVTNTPDVIIVATQDSVFKINADLSIPLSSIVTYYNKFAQVVRDNKFGTIDISLINEKTSARFHHNIPPSTGQHYNV